MTTLTSSEPHYLVCYFGTKYAPMLGVLLQSIADVEPQRKVVLLHYDTPAEVLCMAQNYPNVISRSVERQNYPAAMAAGLKPLIIADYLRSPTLAGPALVVDCDMLVRLDPFNLFRNDDGILFTTREGIWPINGGIIGIRDPLDPAACRFFREWAERIATIARDPALLEVARSEKHSYGHVDQMAFAQIIDYTHGKTEFAIPNFRGLQARAVNGYILNETRSIPINSKTRILHFKAGWHPILLDGRTFTKHRPMRAGWEMFTLYWHTHARAVEKHGDFQAKATLRSTPVWFDSRSHSVNWLRYAPVFACDAVRRLAVSLRLLGLRFLRRRRTGNGRRAGR